MDKYEVIFYETEDGTRPAYDFIETLSPKMQAKIYNCLLYTSRCV